jgi:uncharacterized protein YidB (DUF937 family)
MGTDATCPRHIARLSFSEVARQEIIMGLLDILNGMANGPRGPSDPNDKSGGMSPITMAILALLAYKGYKHVTGGQPQPAPQGQPQQAPVPTQANAEGGGLGGLLGGLLGGNSSAGNSGGIGDLLRGPLGGILGGAAAGSVLSGGLGDLVKRLQENGHAEAADSWVQSGPNKQIAPGDLGAALGADDIAQLTSRTGMSREQLLSELSNELPGAVDEFTPHGRLPTEDEASSRWV